MKKILLLIALFSGIGLAIQAQTVNINAPSGTITAGCSDYINDVNRTWNVDIGSKKRVKIEYFVDTEDDYDFATIYSIDASGNSRLLFNMSGRESGTAYSEFTTGKIQVRFTSDYSVCCDGDHYYYGLNLSFSADDRTVIEGPIAGTLSGGALRIKTNYGNLDLGSQDPVYANLSTDRNRFLFNKPVFLQNGILSSLSSGGLYFQTNGTTRMSILNSNGNVGIGTISPQTKLQVEGSIYLPSGSSYWIGNYTDSGNRLRMHHSGSGACIDYAPSLSIRSGINTVATFLGNGNVGIGVSNPQSKLDVNGEIRVIGSGNEGVPIIIQNDSKNQVGQANLWKIWNMTGYYGNSLQFWAYEQGEAGCVNGGLCGSRLTLMDNGNVGIGTSSPGYKLEVNGTIRTKEVKIESTNWPDYVFSSQYQLPSLEAVSNHIKENKHLPGIPSAKEVEETGINLGELNAKLLQKIEELTLYVIDLKKEIDELKQQK